jgi:hypothetical protein
MLDNRFSDMAMILVFHLVENVHWQFQSRWWVILTEPCHQIEPVVEVLKVLRRNAALLLCKK